MKNIRNSNGFRAARWFVALCAFAFFSAAHAATVLPQYLDDLIDKSAVAFEGTCTGNRSARDPATHQIVTYTTFEVRDLLKGTVGSTHVIKQIGGTLPAENRAFHMDGVPTFTVGQDYVVFLAGSSSAGFSSPIGLGQGSFDVKDGPSGKEVGNGRDLKEMSARVVDQLSPGARARFAQSTGPVRTLNLDDFKETVRNHLAGVQR